MSLDREGRGLLARASPSLSAADNGVAAPAVPPLRVSTRRLLVTLDCHYAHGHEEDDAHCGEGERVGQVEVGGEADSIVVFALLAVAVTIALTLSGGVTLDGGIAARPKNPTLAARELIYRREGSRDDVDVDPALGRPAVALTLLAF